MKTKTQTNIKWKRKKNYMKNYSIIMERIENQENDKEKFKLNYDCGKQTKFHRWITINCKKTIRKIHIPGEPGNTSNITHEQHKHNTQ